jgi:hypothetical protein
MSRHGARVFTLLVAMPLVLGAPDARAYDAAVDASFSAQLYQVTSPFGSVLRRRRFTEMLSLRIQDLQGDHDPKGPALGAVARLRLDSDFGQDPAERDPGSPGRYVPGLAEEPLDLMMAYVEGRNYAGGLVGFRLGRQYVIDPLGWWSFDGGLVRLTTPAHFSVEAYGGSEQRGGLPLSTSRFEADGVFRGNRRGMDPQLWPAYLSESHLAPAYGVAIASAGLDWLDTRLTYRKVQNLDTVAVSPYPDLRGNFETLGGARVSSERLGWAGTATAAGVGSVQGAVVYDALAARPSEYAASIDWLPASTVDVGVDAGYFLPTFDGDSIWNWFAHMGTTTVEGRARWANTRHLAFSVTGGVRRFDTEGAAALADILGSIDATYRSPDEAASLRLMNESGERGRRRGGDAATRRFFVGGLYDASAVVSVYDWADPLRPAASATSFTYVLGGGFRPLPRTRLGVEWEHSMSDLVGQRFRAVCTLDLTVL